MLIEMLKALGLGAGLSETVFDMSVGYDLAGIRSAKIRGFLDRHDGRDGARRRIAHARSPTPSASSATCRSRPAFPTR